MAKSSRRAVLALLLISLWMVLLFTGHPLAGAVHLLLFAALAIAPWWRHVLPLAPLDPEDQESSRLR
ncbi:MAG: hypothetical protein AAF604_17070 [Acidobacteriota bacterium]